MAKHHDRQRRKSIEATTPELIQKTLRSGAVRLDLCKLGLSTLPDTLGQLTQLEYLDLSLNELTALPESLGQLTWLLRLKLFHNQLSDLPESLGQLTRLEDLDLSDNQLRVLPESLTQINNLRTLDLSGNQLTRLPESLGQLGELRVLDLSVNRLTRLPESLQRLASLEVLDLNDNKALKLPKEVLGSTRQEERSYFDYRPASPAQILDYYFRIRSGSRPLNEAKLILLGRGLVGKTCIVNRLVHHIFNPNLKKTDGICITQWKRRFSATDEVRLNIWDFGGQEIMHSTHQFFLTQRSLYVLVLNGREGSEDTDVEYWLQLIGSFGGESPVIVVLNKIKEQPFDLNRRALQQKYPTIRAFLNTDCADETGLAELDAAIWRETNKLQGLRDSFPASWFAVKDQLADMKENYLSFDRYRHLCEKFGEREPEAQENLAASLHRLGIALNFKDDPRLVDTHVLNPRWITEGIYKLLNAHKLADQKGVLRLADIAGILDNSAYPPSKHLFLLDLMKKFELCFEFPDDFEHRYLVPQLLDKQEPDLNGEFQPEQCLNFEYHYNIVPEGLLPRFIVRTHVLSAKHPRWRSGVVLEFEGNRALVRADARDRKITTATCGPVEGRRRLLAVIRSDFEAIHGDIKKLQVEEMVPVKERPDVVIAYKELKVWEQKGRLNFEKVIGDDIVDVDVREMLHGVDLEGARSVAQLRKSGEPLRVFISYSHKDETLRAKLETHLKLLQRQGLISLWTDRKISAGEEWKGEIDDNLESSGMILLLISPDFVASDYCYDVEMRRALERHEVRTARVIPIILRTVDWHSAPFGKLQALPTGGKPVTLWADKDSAWNDVASGIRKVAEQGPL